ncbi:MAG TPA: CRTAC1 family protein, partial [Fimbriimonadaceae bacterium]|nr:CRTAC1 family protein [Fimbriimonadaceae bacterium]
YNAVATSPGFGGGHSIGACWGDFDNDGQFDLFAGNFAHIDSRGDQPKSRFLRNLGPKGKYHFEDMGTCGVFYQESYASPAAGDYDNDGNLDLFFTTVYGTASFGKKNFPVLYRNAGRFVFTDVTEKAGVANLPPTYQAAWADFNHDGQLDLVSGGKLFVNNGNKNHWIEVRLVGDGVKVNRSAIGAQVRIRGNRTWTRQVEAGTGEGNQNDLTLHFGLGDNNGPVDLDVTWPNRKTQRVSTRVDRIVEVRYKE